MATEVAGAGLQDLAAIVHTRTGDGDIMIHGTAAELAGITAGTMAGVAAGATVTDTIRTGATTTTLETTATTAATTVAEITTEMETARIMDTVHLQVQEVRLHQITTEVATQLQLRYVKHLKEATWQTLMATAFQTQRHLQL
jgi:hypothetical protein